MEDIESMEDMEDRTSHSPSQPQQTEYVVDETSDQQSEVDGGSEQSVDSEKEEEEEEETDEEGIEDEEYNGSNRLQVRVEEDDLIQQSLVENVTVDVEEPGSGTQEETEPDNPIAKEESSMTSTAMNLEAFSSRPNRLQEIRELNDDTAIILPSHIAAKEDPEVNAGSEHVDQGEEGGRKEDEEASLSDNQETAEENLQRTYQQVKDSLSARHFVNAVELSKADLALVQQVVESYRKG